MLKEFKKELKYSDPADIFQNFAGKKHNFLFESRAISHIYGRFSLVGFEPILEIKGKNDNFSIKILNPRGRKFFQKLAKDKKIQNLCPNLAIKNDEITGKISHTEKIDEESEHTKQINCAQIIRIFLEIFHNPKHKLMGLYGAFSYDFIRLFEGILKKNAETDIPDFHLFLYDTFIYFDHLREKTELVSYREKKPQPITITSKKSPPKSFQITNSRFETSKNEYEKLVTKAQELARQGELFEVVFSNTLHANFKGNPFDLYLKYREANPSPYLFYFDFGHEYLVGASPEMMVRCEENKVHMRPISGTAQRSGDPIEDHENMLDLLKCEKERSELDMLIDLGRNDLSRICKPGIEIKDYRFVEKYSKVMHTVAHLTGELRAEFTAFDALISCLNAGTLTGAPKVAAMNEIEKNEKSRRGYYGGACGYLTLNGNMDTAIIIRTAHIKNGKLTFRVGATLLYDSDPASEYQETINKAHAFLTLCDYEIKKNSPYR